MKRFASLLFFTLCTIMFFAAKPALAQTAAINPADGTIAFGTVAVGSSGTPAVGSFHRTNALGGGVTVASVTLSDTVNYSIQDECTGVALGNPVTSPQTSFCRITVDFHPTVSGAIPAATVSIASNAGGSPHVFNLSGTGIQASISPAAPVIPDTLVGDDSGAAMVIVTNTGTEPLDIGALDVVGEDFVNFSITNDNCSNTTVAALSDCIFEVIFSPDEVRTFNANVNIPSNDPNAPNFLLAITGNGLANQGVTLNPTSLDFLDVGVGNTSPAQLVQVTNSGTTDLSVTTAALATGLDFAIIGNTCDGAVVAPGGSCVVQVVCSPTATGPLVDSVDITSDAPSSVDVVDLDCNGVVGPIMTVKPSSLQIDFPDTGVGHTSQAEILEIHNTGTTPLENIIVPLPVIPEYAYLQDHCSGSTLNPGESCLVQITFTPSADLTFTELVTITADNVSNVVVTLEGTGVFGPSLLILPSSLTLSFPDTGVGRTSQALTLELHSAGTTPVENVTIPNPGTADFVKVQDNCSGEDLAPGQSCLATFVFAPTSALTFNETLTITSDNVASQDVDLEGEGIVGPAVGTNPASLDFGDVILGQTSSAQAVQITNTGTTTLNVTTVALLTGTDFSVSSNSCNGNAIVPGGSCQVQVTCSPTATGPLTDSLDITSDAASSVDSVTVDCNGIQSDISSLGSGAFGNVNVGSQGGPNTITLTNEGDADLVIGTLARVGDDTNQFSLRNDTCSGQTLTPGEDCDFQAVFSPTAGGAFTDTVLIPNNSSTPSFTINLTGTGIVPVPPGVGLLQIKTDVMDFDLEIGQSGTQSTTVTNIGDGAVTINALALEGDSQFSQTNDCEGQTLAPGASCTITATFSSSSVDNFNAVITIDSNPATTSFLVLLGSTSSDEIGGGGCSLSTGTQALSLSWMWMGLLPTLAAGLIRRRAR